MVVNNSNGCIKLIAEDGKKITNKQKTFFSDFAYLPITANIEDYEEVGREIWKHFVQEEHPDITELTARTEDLQQSVKSVENDTFILKETQLLTDETVNIVIGAVADSDEKREVLTDTMLLAFDELFVTFIEPIIGALTPPAACMSVEEEQFLPKKTPAMNNLISHMGVLYCSIVQRGLKDISQIPSRYVEEVKKELGLKGV